MTNNTYLEILKRMNKKTIKESKQEILNESIITQDDINSNSKNGLERNLFEVEDTDEDIEQD